MSDAMKFRDETERMIYATSYSVTFATEIERGYPHAWREADRRDGRELARIGEWERWCAGLAVESAQAAVSLRRAVMKLRKGGR